MSGDLLDELDEAAIAAGHDCYCGRSPDICEDAGGCPASREIAHLRAALRRHMQWCTGKHGTKVCGGCLRDWPCPDAGLAKE